jgi:hypothetical protein
VGKVWKGAGGAPDRPVTAGDFAEFSAPGFAKLAESTVVMPYGSGCVLTAESRVALTDDDSRRRFRRYLMAAGPFIRLMRPMVMDALARQLSGQRGELRNRRLLRRDPMSSRRRSRR